ncbi:PREDICTED: ovalbumin-like [Gekko japonicus]|uniref:Ovalbumin-like n=1 Tax=Gekko japonicus TaxID=146911 RepID=A0ABM1KX24_GEKJA|nr:PREDICTED: ovalbumin-like [Gekko japonicus]
MASQVAESNGEFCFDLFRELSHANVDANVFFSPFSILSALAMVYLGASGQTASQLQKVLHFDKFTEPETSTFPQCQQPNSVHTALGSVLSQIRALDTNDTLSIANRLYAERSYPILPKYLKCTKELYRAGLEKVDFQKSSEQARLAINAWVESQTNGLIKDMFASGSIPSRTILVLVNAIHFKEKWASEFNTRDTKQMLFMVNEKVNRSVQMMHHVSDFNFASIEKFNILILELPYANNEMSMVILLPKDNFGLLQLQRLITYKELLKWMKSMRQRKVEVYVPRMKMEEKYSLIGILGNLGITDLFTPRASLTGISSAGGLDVSEIIHKSYVEVNEEGTEAAAATGIQIRLTSFEKPVVFRADHPFLFFVIHKKTNLIIFSGKVSSP